MKRHSWLVLVLLSALVVSIPSCAALSKLNAMGKTVQQLPYEPILPPVIPEPPLNQAIRFLCVHEASPSGSDTLLFYYQQLGESFRRQDEQLTPFLVLKKNCWRATYMDKNTFAVMKNPKLQGLASYVVFFHIESARGFDSGLVHPPPKDFLKTIPRVN